MDNLQKLLSQSSDKVADLEWKLSLTGESTKKIIELTDMLTARDASLAELRDQNANLKADVYTVNQGFKSKTEELKERTQQLAKVKESADTFADEKIAMLKKTKKIAEKLDKSEINLR